MAVHNNLNLTGPAANTFKVLPIRNHHRKRYLYSLEIP